MNLASLRSRVYDRLGEDSSDPQRWPAPVVTEYLNDGIQLLSSRARLQVSTHTITARPEILYYPLPEDCIAVLAVYDDELEDALDLIGWRDLDRSITDAYFMPESATRMRQRWVRALSTRATHAFVFGLREIALWPMLGPEEITDDVAFSDGFTGDGSTSTFSLSVTPGGLGVWWNGGRLKRVSSGPSAIQYTLSGTTVTMGTAPYTGNRVSATVSSHSSFTVGETPDGDIDGSNDTYDLAATPSSASAVALYVNGIRLNNAGALPEGGITAIAHGSFVVSGAQVQLRDAPPTGATLYADYTTDDDDVIVGEVPEGDRDGENKDFVLSEQPAAFSEVAVFVSGVRITRTTTQPGANEFMLAGRTLHVGTAPADTSAVYCDYVRVPQASNRDYTIHYLQDQAENLADDSDSPDVGENFHEALLDYVVARCLLPKARGERVKRAAQLLSKFNGSVEQARAHNRNNALTPSVDSYGSYT